MENQIDRKKPIAIRETLANTLSSLEKLAVVTYSVVKCPVMEAMKCFTVESYLIRHCN